MPPYGEAGEHGFGHFLRACFLEETPAEFFETLVTPALEAAHPGMFVQLPMRPRLEAIIRAGKPLPAITPHDLRHTAGTQMLR